MPTHEELFKLYQGRAEGFGYRRYTEAIARQEPCHCLTRDEYAQCALIGLDRALAKLDPAKTDREFWQYAYRCMRNEIASEYNRLGRLASQKTTHEPFNEVTHTEKVHKSAKRKAT